MKRYYYSRYYYYENHNASEMKELKPLKDEKEIPKECNDTTSLLVSDYRMNINFLINNHEKCSMITENTNSEIGNPKGFETTTPNHVERIKTKSYDSIKNIIYIDTTLKDYTVIQHKPEKIKSDTQSKELYDISIPEKNNDCKEIVPKGVINPPYFHGMVKKQIFIDYRVVFREWFNKNWNNPYPSGNFIWNINY